MDAFFQNDRAPGHARGRKFLSTRISIYPNSQASFQLSRLVESGDVCPNPGPKTAAHNPAKCSVCKKTVAKTNRAINCDSCLKWCHIKSRREIIVGFSWRKKFHGFALSVRCLLIFNLASVELTYLLETLKFLPT